MRFRVIITAWFLFLVGTCAAQVADPVSFDPAVVPPIPVKTDAVFPADRCLNGGGELHALWYHDSTLERILWRVPTNYGQFTSLNIGQRFDLPGERGFLDSIHVFIRELPLGRMRFDVWYDTMRTRVSKDSLLYHYPNYWAYYSGRKRDAVIDSAFLEAGMQDTSGMTTIRFAHTPIQRFFHVVAAPHTDSTITSLFGIYTDAALGELATINPENARAHMLWNLGGNIVPVHMRGRFTTMDTTNPKELSPALYMTAFVEVEGPTGLETVALPSGASLGSPYPQPALALVSIPFHIPHHQHMRLEIYDAVGHRVLTLFDEEIAAGRHICRFDVSRLPSGAYVVRMTTKVTTLTRPLRIVH
ncbi:MAG: T9SS type A sorting domain-containing protein [Bacteroidota bacterium]|nr:T9SS type A sorting domain-containing protein [Bacteroidota bacterium]